MRKRLDDDFLYEKLPEAERKLVEELPFEQPEHRFSFGFRRKMHLLLGRKLERERQIGYSVRKRILLTAAVLLFLSVGAFLSSEANRIRVFEFVIRRYPEYTEIMVESDVNVPGDVMVEPVDPSYVPEGYQLKETIHNDMSYMLVYMNEKGTELYYDQGIITQSGMHLDTEDAVVENVDVEGLKLMTIEKKGHVMIYWHDDRHIFLLSGDIEKDELMRMAESVIKK